MSAESRFRIGTVEGFFGRQWSWEARRDHATFLAEQQLTTYVYAPKNDAYLRRQWFELHPDNEFHELKSLAHHAVHRGIEFGVGLSPYELYRDFSAANRDKLKRKLDQLNELNAPLLSVLFDDMLGDLPGLAATQLAIFDCVRQHSNAAHFMLCPTYYSDDPLLVRHFGKQPESYLQELGDGLPKDVDVFWTGPKVISASYPRDHLLEMGARLQRKPLLWDNYPVNDAKRLTSFLHLLPFEQRDNGKFSLRTIAELCSGLLANPMNQAALSKVALASLAQGYGEITGRSGISRAFGNIDVRNLLAADAARFQFSGLEKMSDGERAILLKRYQAYLPDPMCEEVCEWLDGRYAFDPACLT